ncbi:neuronal acetylcholine receptor subunit beta-3-like [Physella acuta]|uniref:neuronal acetylcholine receptor subunit beta-3-like n=1 Tax=Physella acuta TaxID=109671 RepID=UPI0027DB8BEF|nr:neuronal acetylcholine receptor subunit beta-3-like [Physella acuta]
MKMMLVLISCVCSLLTSAAARAPETTFLAYEQLRRDVLNRTTVVNQIPAGFMNTTGRPYPMSIGLLPIDVIEVDDIKQFLTVVVYINLTWAEPTLQWTPADHEDIDTLYLPSNLLWTPEITVAIGDTQTLNLELDDTLIVSSSGTVSSQRQQYLTFRCEINFLKYPFDSQACYIGFYPSKTHPSPYFTITTLPLNFKRLYNVPGEWELVDYGHEMVDTNSSLPLTVYPRYNFILRRRYLYYVITIIFPLVLTSLMIPLVFLIPTRTGEKISYLVAIFTSTAIFLNFISVVMPRGLTSLPYLAVLLVEVMFEGLAAIFAALAVVTKFDEEEHHYKEKKLTSTLQAVKVRKVDVAPLGLPKKTPDEHNSDKVTTKNKRPTLTSRQLDRVFLYVFFGVQLVFLACLFGCTGWI